MRCAPKSKAALAHVRLCESFPSLIETNIIPDENRLEVSIKQHSSAREALEIMSALMKIGHIHEIAFRHYGVQLKVPCGSL